MKFKVWTNLTHISFLQLLPCLQVDVLWKTDFLIGILYILLNILNIYLFLVFEFITTSSSLFANSTRSPNGSLMANFM